MLADLRAPRELVFLLRLIAILGATKIGTIVYFDLLNPTPPSAAEIEASEREIRAIAAAGEARVYADFRGRAGGVLEAARRCDEDDRASCRWAEIWIERYAGRARDILGAPDRYDAATVAAARTYRRAEETFARRDSGAGLGAALVPPKGSTAGDA